MSNLLNAFSLTVLQFQVSSEESQLRGRGLKVLSQSPAHMTNSLCVCTQTPSELIQQVSSFILGWLKHEACLWGQICKKAWPRPFKGNPLLRCDERL